MANGTLSSFSFTNATSFGDSTSLKIKDVHINELRAAVNKLESWAANVDNCGNCTFCQSCQSCQSYKCQSQCA